MAQRTQQEWQAREKELLETTTRYLERAREEARLKSLYHRTLSQILNGQAIINGNKENHNG